MPLTPADGELAATGHPVLEAHAVSKEYPGGVQALRGASLTVARGETVVLIGESGCGKTTLLRMFNRLEEPTEGDVLIAGDQAFRRTGLKSQGLDIHLLVLARETLAPQEA